MPHSRNLIAAALVLASAGAAVAQTPRPLSWVDMQEIRAVTGQTVSPDGKRVAYQLMSQDWRRGTSQSDIYLVSTDRGLAATKRLTSTEDKAELRPTWLPGGRHLVFASNADGPALQLYVTNPDSGIHRKFTSSATPIGTFELTADGQWLVYRSGRSATDQQLYAIAVDRILAGGDVPARQITNHPTGVVNWRLSPDSRRILFTSPDSIDTIERDRRAQGFVAQIVDHPGPMTSLWTVAIDGGTATALAKDSALSVVDATFSPDGRWVAFRALPSDRYKRNSGAESILYGDNYLVELATGRIERLTNNELVPETAVLFSPDSRTILYGADDKLQGLMNNRRLYSRAIDDRGGKWRKLGIDFDGDVSFRAWTPDGRILFDAGKRATQQLFTIDIATGKVEQLTSAAGVVGGLPGLRAGHPVVFSFEHPRSPMNLFAARSISDLADQSKWVQLTNANPQLENIAYGETSEVEWTSRDGTKIGGVLVKPVGYQAGKRYPLLVILHGGPHSAEVLTFNGDDIDGPQVYAGAGYVVFAPNYRASTNYGSKIKTNMLGDYMGHAFNDVMTGVDHLIALGLVDGNRMAVAGHSAGGTLGNWILTHTTRFKAISTGAGVVNWISLYGTSDFKRPREEWFLGKSPYEDFDGWWNQSPLKYIRNARTPTLIYGTEGDPRVPSGQARELYTALRRLGVTTELVLYPGSDHGTVGAKNRLAHGIIEQAFIDYHVRGIGKPFPWKDVMATLPPAGK